MLKSSVFENKWSCGDYCDGWFGFNSVGNAIAATRKLRLTV